MLTLRIGVLGAAKIAPKALLMPASRSPRVKVVAVAARDRERAASFAVAHGIPDVEPTYAALLARPDIDAVYVALPAALHHPWTMAALKAGKHVLCEKPFACNAGEAEEMIATAEQCSRVVMEAFHDRFHPFADRMRQIATSGELGAVRTIEARFDAAIDPSDIRYVLALGGGALMDLGCYCVAWARLAAGGEPIVQTAKAVVGPASIDVAMDAELGFPNGARATIGCSMERTTSFKAFLRVIGDAGEMRAENPLVPQDGRIEVTVGATQRTETFSGEATYAYQLAAFADAIEGFAPKVSAKEPIFNMRAIDAIYRAAGLAPRGR